MPNEILIVPNGNGATNKPDNQPNGNGATDGFGSDAHKEAVTKWVEATVAKVIAVIRAEAAVRYHDIDDEEHGALDLKGEYDPIVDKETGARLSDAIAEKAAEFKMPEKRLHDLYVSALKKQWEQEPPLSSDLDGERVGKKLMVNGGGVWMQLETEGIDTLYVWRRICRTEIKAVAWSHDMTPQFNWRARYLVSGEIGQFKVEIGLERLGKHANSGISKLMRHGVRVVESKEAREALATYLRIKPKALIIRAPKIGWFEVKKGRWGFVLPNETLGASNVVLDVITKNHGLDRAGTTAQWIEHIAKPHEHNTNVVLSIGVFFAAPLLRWAAEPGGGFHFHGHSKDGKTSKEGKTLVAVLGQSVYGLPLEKIVSDITGARRATVSSSAPYCETISVCRSTSLAFSSIIMTLPCSLTRCLVEPKKGASAKRNRSSTFCFCRPVKCPLQIFCRMHAKACWCVWPTSRQGCVMEARSRRSARICSTLLDNISIR